MRVAATNDVVSARDADRDADRDGDILTLFTPVSSASRIDRACRFYKPIAEGGQNGLQFAPNPLIHGSLILVWFGNFSNDSKGDVGLLIRGSKVRALVRPMLGNGNINVI